MLIKEKVRTLNFEELNLNDDILSGIKDVNRSKPTSLQETIIPAILEGKDTLIKADEGDDKNAAIALTALQKFSSLDEQEGTHILVLTPNSKEADEIDQLIWAMGYHAEVECAPIHLDGDESQQLESIQNGVPILVANPGQLIDLLENNRIILRHVDYLVIDRMDKMIAIGLVNKLNKIFKRVLSSHQTVIFTSELNEKVSSYAKEHLEEPTFLGFEDSETQKKLLETPPEVPQNLTQAYIKVPPRMKITTLLAHLDQTPEDRCVIFTASKRGTDRLYRSLRKRNKKATSLHGKLSDQKRAQRFANFTNGDVQYLLVADISAAELDLRQVTQVINYDVPKDPDEYRYRANLVGSGKASRIVSLVSKQDRSDINQLQNELGEAPEELPLPKEVQKKAKQRNNKRGGRKKSRSKRGRGKQGKSSKKKKEMELPRPSYEKLSGGRTGEKDERTGVVEFFRNLFS